jgi:hypothetical protein
MEDMDMRHGLLMELIDKMHGRLADKMFPPDHSLTDTPAVEGITKSPMTAEGVEVPGTPAPATEGENGDVSMHGDMSGDSHGIPADGEMSDEELDELMKMDK